MFLALTNKVMVAKLLGFPVWASMYNTVLFGEKVQVFYVT